MGPITLVAHTSVDSFPRAMTALSTELAQLSTPTAFTDEELADSRQSRLVETALLLEHRTLAGQEIAEFWGSAGLGYFVTYPDRLVSVNRQQISAYVDRYMGHSPTVIGVMSPPGSAHSLQPVVVGFLNPEHHAMTPRDGNRAVSRVARPHAAGRLAIAFVLIAAAATAGRTDRRCRPTAARIRRAIERGIRPTA